MLSADACLPVYEITDKNKLVLFYGPRPIFQVTSKSVHGFQGHEASIFRHSHYITTVQDVIHNAISTIRVDAGKRRQDK